MSAVYPLTDYALGVEERNIYKELKGDKNFLSKKSATMAAFSSKDSNNTEMSQILNN